MDVKISKTLVQLKVLRENLDNDINLSLHHININEGRKSVSNLSGIVIRLRKESKTEH